MKIIGAGFGRTGTLSLKVALEELGFGPCYHMTELWRNPGHPELWDAAAQGRTIDWGELFRDYRATLDWPGCTFYRELMETYPDAKVLLSVRDPERWYESVAHALYPMPRSVLMRLAAPLIGFLMQLRLPAHERAKVRLMARVVGNVIWDGTFSGRFEGRRYAIEVFNRHNEEVKKHVPPDRLLVYEVKEGWEPLCEFLGVEVPKDKTFPHLNDGIAAW